MKSYIKRIKQINPHINALIHDRFESALKEAKELDERIQQELSGNKYSDGLSINSLPLLGIPFSCKECIAVKDMYFTAGLYSRKGIKAEEDSPVVKNMRKAGAIPIGVTNIPEFGIFWDSDNKIYGRTNNPYDKSRISGGSSGGEAALISGTGSIIGMGSDMAGSIRIPSYFCGIYGHMPTAGVIPNSGIFPDPGSEREKFVRLGPLCRYARDLRPVLRAAAGENISRIKLDEKVDFGKLKVYYMESDCDPSKTSVSLEITEAMHKVAHLLDSKTENSSEILCLSQMKGSFWIWICTIFNTSLPSLAWGLTERTGVVNGWSELCKWFIGKSDYRLSTTLTLILLKMLNPMTNPETQRFKKIISKGEDIKAELNKLLGI